MKHYKLLLSTILFITSLFAEENQKVSLQLLWKHQFEFAGFYMAKEKGFYKDVGLDVEFKEYQIGSNISQDVADGKSDFGIGYSGIILDKIKGADIKLLNAIYQSSPHVLVSLQSSKINSIKDFKNKTISMTNSHGKTANIKSMIYSQKISLNDMKIKEYTYGIDALLNGKTEIQSVYLSNEIFKLKEKNIPYNIWDPKDYGFSFYDNILFTSTKLITQNPHLVKEFQKASLMGWEYAFNNIDETINLILKKYNTQNKTKEALVYEANELKKLAYYETATIGKIEKSKIQRIIDIYNLMGFIESNIPITDFIYEPYEMQPIATNKTTLHNTINLTQLEIEHLKNKKSITMCIDPNWMPFEKFDNKKHIGISADYFKIFEQNLGKKIEVIETKTWEQSLQYAQQRKCDLLSLAMETPKRKEYMNFTTPYLSVPLVIATQTHVTFINDIKALKGKKIGIPKGYAFVEIFKKKYPFLNIIEVENLEKGLRQVKKGQLFGYIGTLASVGYMFQTQFMGELKIAGKFDETWELGIGVRNDDTILLDIMEKVVQSVDKGQSQSILNNWLAIKYEQKVNYTLLWQLFIIISIVIIFIIYRQIILKNLNKNLQKIVEEKTKELVNLNENLENIVKQRTQELNDSKTKLNESYRDIKHILDSTMEAIFIFENGYCIDVNEEAVRLYHYPEKSMMIGKKAIEFVAENYIDIVIKNIQRNYTQPYEIYMKRYDETTFPAFVRGNNLARTDKLIRVTSVLDLTELKSKETLLIQQSKMAALGEMIANISHQWRQPLSVISTVASGMKLKIEYNIFNKDDEMQNLDILLESTTYLSTTIDDFKNFLHPEKTHKIFNIRMVIDKTILMFGKNFTSHNIQIIINGDNSEIIGNENELLQVIINIINNAKDSLISKRQETNFIFIDLYTTNKNIILTIKDNGGGISEDVLPKIFDAYFTTKHKSVGTGIGLYMSYQIITNSFEGNIVASNEEYIYNNTKYIGAKFTITLPVKSKD